MAQKLLNTTKAQVASKKDAVQETGIVLVGTYSAAQMKKWILPKGYYNYPVGEEDDCTPAHCKRIKELWLYKGKSARKVFSAEFIGVKTRAELPDYPATKTKPHGVLCAGFPCQAFSKDGKQLGFEDIRRCA